MMTKKAIREEVEALFRRADGIQTHFNGKPYDGEGVELQCYCGKRGDYAVVTWPPRLAENEVHIYEVFDNGWYEPPKILPRDIEAVTNYIYRKLRPLEMERLW